MTDTTELKFEFEKLVLKERVNSKYIESWIRKKFGEESSIRPILSETFKEIYLAAQSEGDVPSQRQLIQISYIFYGMDPDFILKEILMKYLYWEQLEEKSNFFFAFAAKYSLSRILSRLRQEDLDFLLSFIPKCLAYRAKKFPFLEFLRLLSNSSEDASASIRTELDLQWKELLEYSKSDIRDLEDYIGNLLLLDLSLGQKSALPVETLSDLLEQLIQTHNSTTLAVLSLVLYQWQRNPENFNTYQVAKKYSDVTKKMIFDEKLFSFIKDSHLGHYLLFDTSRLVISLFPFLQSYDQKRVLNNCSSEIKQECYNSQGRVDFDLWEVERIIHKKSLLIEKSKKFKTNLESLGVDNSEEIREDSRKELKRGGVDIYDLENEVRDDLSLCNPLSLNFGAAMDALEGLAKFSRRSGLLAIEDLIGSTEDPFLQLGLQAICDGTDPEEMKYLLDPRIKGYIDAVERYFNMLKIGILKIQEGTNPRILRQILEGYMRDKNVTGIDDAG
jgi:hypothetical protein